MSDILRIILIIGSVLTLAVILKKIRKASMRIDDAIFWVLFSALLILLAACPHIMYRLSELLGFQSPANLLYLIVIFLLLIKVFSMSVQLSILESKLKNITQLYAMDHKDDDSSDKQQDVL